MVITNLGGFNSSNNREESNKSPIIFVILPNLFFTTFTSELYNIEQAEL